MNRVDTPELLDSDACSPEDVQESLRDLGRMNRWFGGVATTQALIECVAHATGLRKFSVLEVAAGTGEVSRVVQERLARRGITLNIKLLDRAQSHLPEAGRVKPDVAEALRPPATWEKSSGAIAADALALPFRDSAFDLVSCNLFAHHLDPNALARFAREALRVSRVAVLINDLVRHPLHLALVYSAFPLMRSAVSRVDGVASVRRAYVPEEMREILSSGVGPARKIEILSHFLFRMGVTLWK
ncbi:MAG TPA: methyltransferase domain-containing protein [Candidatus Sulfotelmatobacter sp.]